MSAENRTPLVRLAKRSEMSRRSMWLIRVGSIVVALMFYSALMQRSIFYAVGAFLFVISDFILAWNTFIEPIEYSRYLIMVPYFVSEWMFYVRATKYRVGKSILLARL